MPFIRTSQDAGQDIKQFLQDSAALMLEKVHARNEFHVFDNVHEVQSSYACTDGFFKHTYTISREVEQVDATGKMKTHKVLLAMHYPIDKKIPSPNPMLAPLAFAFGHHTSSHVRMLKRVCWVCRKETGSNLMNGVHV
jgi:hypothetical protein